MAPAIDLPGISSFIPHGYCMRWSSDLLWLSVGSDILMALSYFTYPIGIAYFCIKRKDLKFRWLYLGFFVAFIVTCAATHVLGIITVWYPLYWEEAWVKFVSSLVAFATVPAIWWVIPQALEIPSQEELERSRDRAEAANRAKSAFLANMSHELRTPLNAILGFSTIIQKDETLPESQRRNVEIINSSGEHLLSLINDVLDMAKIDAGRAHIEELPFDLGSMIRDVTDMMSIRAEDKGLQLIIDQSSEFPRYIIGDEARLRQILINLIGNAIKFTRQGGVSIRLGARQNAISHLMIEVEDTGPGIATKDQQRIFDPFVQLGDQGDSKGTGLGLTITKQFVELMGGQLLLESTPGKGSLFRIDLPLKEAKKEEIAGKLDTAHGAVLGLAPNQPAYRVLIVEDQTENQLLLSQLMEAVGIESKIAKDGLEGVELFKAWKPHLIWMDRRMPHMDGIEASKAIRQLPDSQEVKIVAVTASAFMEQRDEMLQSGMDDFVRKPYRASEIYDCMARLLGVKFLYESADTPEEAVQVLTQDMMDVLSDTLRNDFKAALEILDSKRIAQVLEEIAQTDPRLCNSLQPLVDNFDYPTILKLLDGN